jgi:CheY-like chemotaxis protein
MDCEFIERLRLIPGRADVPVVMVTADTESDVRHRALQLGAQDFLTKPVDKVELTARVRNLLALRKSQQQLADRAAWLAEEVTKATAEIAAREKEAILRLSRAAEYRDPETGSHLLRMSNYTRLIATQLGLPAAEQQLLLEASPMHDIGKVGTPDQILLKPGRLTPEEFEIMKQHATIGYEILRDSVSPLLQCAAKLALAHHEKFDGSGYPLGLAGEAISHARAHRRGRGRVRCPDLGAALQEGLDPGCGRRLPEDQLRQPFRPALRRGFSRRLAAGARDTRALSRRNRQQRCRRIAHTLTAMLDPSQFVELKASGNLPSPKGAALKVIELCQRDNVTLPEIIQVLQIDPAMVGRILKLANSAAFGRPRPAVALTPDVLMSIGIQSVRQVVLAFSLVSGNRNGQCPGFDYELFWSRSAATGVAAQLLGAATRAAPPAELFTVGLLANIGRMALAALHAERYGALITEAGGQFAPGADVAGAEDLRPHPPRRSGRDDARLGPAQAVHRRRAVPRERRQLADFGIESRSGRLAYCLHLATQDCRSLLRAAAGTRRRNSSSLLPLSKDLGIPDGNLVALGDQMLREWKDWSAMLELGVREVVPFSALEAEPESPGIPSAPETLQNTWSSSSSTTTRPCACCSRSCLPPPDIPCMWRATATKGWAWPCSTSRNWSLPI